jgi:hypothetical protein
MLYRMKKMKHHLNVKDASGAWKELYFSEASIVNCNKAGTQGLLL